MKKFLAMLVLLILCVGLVACAAEKPSAEKETHDNAIAKNNQAIVSTDDRDESEIVSSDTIKEEDEKTIEELVEEKKPEEHETAEPIVEIIESDPSTSSGDTPAIVSESKEGTIDKGGSNSQSASGISHETMPIEHVHQFEFVSKKPATCTEKGQLVERCSDPNCPNHAQKITTYDMLGHDYKVADTKEASCTYDGYIKYVCTRCGDVYKVKLGSTNHEFTEKTKDATCTTDGYVTKTCIKCGKIITKTISALGHKWSQLKYDKPSDKPTCTKAGIQKQTCSRCGASQTETVPQLGHNWSPWTTTVDSTCTQAGTQMRTCSRCDVSQTRKLDSLGHDFSVPVPSESTAATCTQAGKSVFKCSHNGCAQKKTTPIAALGHNWATSVTSPTCTSGGYTTYTCSRCKYSYVDNETSALGHNWSAATCTSPKTCTRCKITSGTELGHAWDSGVVTTPPSTTSTGVKTYNCTRQGCGATYTETLPKLDGTCEHHWVRATISIHDAYARPTSPYEEYTFLCFCANDNLAYYYCDVCGTIDTSRAEYYKSQYDACQEFLGYWNELRASLGLTKVWYDEGWQEWAEIRAQKIVKQKIPNHDGARGFENADTESANVYQVFVAWCNSPGHYANLVFPWYTDIYAGFAWGLDIDREIIGWVVTGDDYRR